MHLYHQTFFWSFNSDSATLENRRGKISHLPTFSGIFQKLYGTTSFFQMIPHMPWYKDICFIIPNFGLPKFMEKYFLSTDWNICRLAMFITVPNFRFDTFIHSKEIQLWGMDRQTKEWTNNVFRFYFWGTGATRAVASTAGREKSFFKFWNAAFQIREQLGVKKC